MSISDKLVVEEIGQAISLLEGVLNRLHSVTQSAPAAEPTTPTKPITLEEVRAKLTALSGSKGGAAVKALLKDFGADKLSDIAAQDYGELLAKAEEMGQ